MFSHPIIIIIIIVVVVVVAFVHIRVAYSLNA